MNHFLPLIGASLTACFVAYTDQRTGKMPNLITLGSLGLAFSAQALLSGKEAILTAFLGFVFCSLAPAGLFFFTKGQGIGGGDVKALMAIGAWLGPGLGLEAELFSLILLSFGAIVHAARAGDAFSLMKRSLLVLTPGRRTQPQAWTSTTPLPNAERTYLRFGPYLAVGVALTCLNQYFVIQSQQSMWF